MEKTVASDVLTRIERKGSYVQIAPGAVDPVMLGRHLIALRVAGHAVVADEVMDHGKSLGIRITHYLNCPRCK
jgi:hypothetical protein